MNAAVAALLDLDCFGTQHAVSLDCSGRSDYCAGANFYCRLSVWIHSAHSALLIFIALIGATAVLLLTSTAA